MLVPESPKPQPANPYSHPFVLIRDGKYVESVVYNAETGARKLVWPIDAREMVKSGGWSFDPPAPREATHESASEPIQGNPTAPVAEIAPAAEYKRGPGRPRKSAA